MADRAIHVAVLEGYFASLTTLGLPMPLSLQLQQSDLRLEGAMWTAKSTRTGFSVSLFWPVNSAIELKQTKKKRRRRNKRKAKAIINFNSNVAPSAPGSCVSKTVPINANPVESDVKVDTCNLPPECKPDSDHSVSPLQEDGPSVSNMSKESDVSDQDEAVAIDLNACSEIVYRHQDDGTHGVKYVCDGKEGWTPVVGKRRKYKVPTRLVRLRAPPHVRATLPSSGSDSDSDSGSDCSLDIPPGADVQYSVCRGKPGLKVTSTSTSTWTPIASRTRSRLKS